MRKATDRILTTHVGSLIRPAELEPYLRAIDEARAYDEAEFAGTLRHCIDAVVRKQTEIGLDIVNDGEFGKMHSWSRYVVERLGGFEAQPPRGSVQGRGLRSPDLIRFADFYKDTNAYTEGFTGRSVRWVCTGPLRYTGQKAVQRDIANIKHALQQTSAAGVFMPVVAPASAIAQRHNEYYKTDEDYLFAVAEALHEEYKTIVDAGFIVQIDDAHLPIAYEYMVPPGTLRDYRKWARVRIDALNHALKGLPEEQVRYHICWGSWNGPHTSDVAMKDIVDLVLRIRAGSYSIEMANPRHEHEWSIWKDVKLPDGKKLVPGVVTHVTNVVEHPELVAERIFRLAGIVGRENVIGSTDCGFAQGPFVRRVHPQIMWAKLESLVAGARLATKKLWPRPSSRNTARRKRRRNNRNRRAA